MDAIMMELDMWLSYPEEYDGVGFYYRLQRVNEIRKKRDVFMKMQEDYISCASRLEQSWTAINFQDYTDASWNYKLSKNEFDELVQKTLVEISMWKGCIYH